MGVAEWLAFGVGLGVALAAGPACGPPGVVSARAVAAVPTARAATRADAANIFIVCRINLITSAGGTGRANHTQVNRPCRNTVRRR